MDFFFGLLLAEELLVPLLRRRGLSRGGFLFSLEGDLLRLSLDRDRNRSDMTLGHGVHGVKPPLSC